MICDLRAYVVSWVTADMQKASIHEVAEAGPLNPDRQSRQTATVLSYYTRIIVKMGTLVSLYDMYTRITHDNHKHQ